MKRFPHSIRRPTTLRALRALVAIVAALTLAHASPSRAQPLMVGADGSIHLDGMGEVTAADPIIVEQQPQLVPSAMQPGLMQPGLMQPGMMQPGMMQPMGVQPGMIGGAPMYVGPDCTVGACPAPMAGYMPMAMAVAAPSPIRHAIFGEFLFLHPTGADVVHAQQQNGIGGAGTVPFGVIGETDLHYEPGVRVGGDWAMGQTTSLAASYTWFESNARSRIEAPVVPGGGGAVGSLVHLPGAGILASAGPVDGRSVLDFQLADAEFRALLVNDQLFWLNGSVGLRWGHLEQEFGQVGVFGGGPGGVIVTQTNIDFDGGGPKLGIDGGRAIGKRGFSVYARAGVSPLAGEFHSNYTLTNQSTATTLAAAHWNDDRVVTLLDYEVGLAWTGPRRRWRFATGYTQAFWYNAVTTSEFIEAVQDSDFTGVGHTITFDGLTARVERMW